MLTYNPKNVPQVKVPEYQQPKKSGKGLLKFFEQAIILIGIEALAWAADILTEGALTPVVAEAQASIISGLVGDLGSFLGNFVYYGVRSKWSIGIMIPYLGRFASFVPRLVKVTKTLGRFERLAKDLKLSENESKALLKEVNQLLRNFRNSDSKGLKFAFEKIEKSGDWRRLKGYIDEYKKFFKSSEYFLRQSLKDKAFLDKDATGIGRIHYFFNSFQRIKRILMYISPSYAVRRAVEKLEEVLNEQTEKLVERYGTEEIGRISKLYLLNPKKYFRLRYQQWKRDLAERFPNKFNHMIRFYDNLSKDENFIPFESSNWIFGIKRFKMTDSPVENVVVYFRPEATNEKEPVYLEKVRVDIIDLWITSTSKGSFYLRRLAWGWEVGKYIRILGGVSNIFGRSFIITEIAKTLIGIRQVWRRYDVELKNNAAGFKRGFTDNLNARKGALGELTRMGIRQVNVGGLILPVYRAFNYKNAGQIVSFGAHRFKTKIRTKRRTKTNRANNFIF